MSDGRVADTGICDKYARDCSPLVEHLLNELSDLAERGAKEDREYGAKLCRHLSKGGKVKLGVIVPGDKTGVRVSSSWCSRLYEPIGRMHTHLKGSIEKPVRPSAADIIGTAPNTVDCIARNDGEKSRVTCYSGCHDTLGELVKAATIDELVYDDALARYKSAGDAFDKYLLDVDPAEYDATRYYKLRELHNELWEAYNKMLATLDRAGDALRCYDKVV